DAARLRRGANRDRRLLGAGSRGAVAMRRSEEAPFAYSGLERVFHERGRLAVCTCLIANSEGLSFADLQSACGLTDGNLNRHLHALRELDVVDSKRARGSNG